MSKGISLNRFLLVLVFGGFSAVLILLLSLDYYSISNRHETIRSEWNNILYHYAYTLESNLEELDSESYSIYASDQAFLALSRGEDDPVSNYTNARHLEDRMLGLLSQNSQVNGYFIFYNNMEKMNMLREFRVLEYSDMQTIRDYLKNQFANKKNMRTWSYQNVGEHAVALSITKKGAALVCLVYNMDLLTEAVRREFAGREAVVYLMHGAEVLSKEGTNAAGFFPEDERSFSSMQDRRYLTGRRIGDTDLWLCLQMPLDLSDYFSWGQFALLLVTITAILLALVAYFYIRRLLIRPMFRLVEQMRAISEGDLECEISVESGFSELQLVETTIEQTLREIRHQKNSLYEETIERQKAQMQYLSMQLKPHFYLNGLKTINAYAMNGNSAKIQDIIMRLSTHMRYILQIEREEVPLQDEIDYVNNYAQLRRDMTDRPIMVDWNIQCGIIHAWKVPTLCMQTFVENSIKYAKLGSTVAELIVRITIDELRTEDGWFLDVIVSDNGEGYPESLLEELNGEPLESSVCVGINNLKRRCRILYNGKAEYLFYNDGGAFSELLIPLTEEGKDL